jgi:hypothetical protein
MDARRWIVWYLIAGGVLMVDLQHHAALVEHITEVVVLISLFSAGLKLRLPFSVPGGGSPCGQRTSMVLTIGSLPGGHPWPWAPLGAAVLLG